MGEKIRREKRDKSEGRSTLLMTTKGVGTLGILRDRGCPAVLYRAEYEPLDPIK